MHLHKNILNRAIEITTAIAFISIASFVHAQPGGPQQPITLGADDKPAFPTPPAGFDKPRPNVPAGKTDTITYNSTSVGNARKMLVYTPPGYSKTKTYPLLVLMHGIGGDEKEWYKYTVPNIVLDNLLADKKIVPMIVIFPNGRAQLDDKPKGNIYSYAPAFAKFDKDLLNDIIPFMEANYPVKKSRESRAMAGFSMGGGQSLNFGLGNLDTFAWIGGFSSAPNTNAPAQLVPDPAQTSKKLKLLYLSCGDKDNLITNTQRLHAYLKENKVPHVYHIDSGAHNMEFWVQDLYHFSQLLFK